MKMNDYAWFAPSIFSIFIWGLSSFLPKLSVGRIQPLDALVYHGLGMMLFGFGVFAWHGFHVPTDYSGSLYAVMVGIMGMLGQIFYLRALQKGPVSVVAIIGSLYPAVTVFLAVILLNETLSEKQGVGVTLAIVALTMLISSKNRKQQNDLYLKNKRYWVFNAVAAMFMWAGWAFFPKIALQTLPPYSVMVHEVLGNMIVIMIVLFFLKFKVQKTIDGLRFCTLASVLSSCAIFSYIYALSVGSVSVISVLTALYPVVTLLLARILMKETLQPVQIASVFLSLIAVSLLVLP